MGIFLLLIALITAAPSAPTVEALDDEPLARVDSLREAGAFQDAFELLQKLQKNDNNHSGILWRLAYIRIELAEEYSSETARERAFRQALQEAEAAVAAGPYNANAYVARAMAAGKVSIATSSNQEKLRLSRVMKESVDQATTLDPMNDVAYYIRGRWHRELASLSFMERTIARALYGGVPDASLKKAVRDIERAIQLQDRIVYRLELARVLIEQDRPSDARAQLHEILRMSADHRDDPRYKQEARKLLEEIGTLSGHRESPGSLAVSYT